ncbi:phage head closure protein [Shouchella lonarensis]|uniref:Phage head-tail adaptor, putative, SPP1 family n=1 Tax=Shouchella lonarensis TaxID=1464122 RepID=A0A1G6IK53_9BACI|nr:phage head closure protein [Shouchella lonarensis]SDC06116.1 phage head-tail adaptor, putative, SPP1 family [Shouchella lonarensis]
MPSLKANVGGMSLDDICDLITVDYITDDIQQEISQETARTVFCIRLSVSRQEFYNAGQAGHKPSMTLLVDSDEYDNEQKFVYQDQTYHVYRSFLRQDGYTELYGEVRTGD